MTVLGIDFGKKRLGLAVADETLLVATPLKVIERKKISDDIKKISDVIDEYQIKKIVIGLPLNMDGTKGTFCDEIEKFGKVLKNKFKIEVVFHNEQLTTREAGEILKDAKISPSKRKKAIDKLSASIILNSYLSSKNTPNQSEVVISPTISKCAAKIKNRFICSVTAKGFHGYKR